MTEAVDVRTLAVRPEVTAFALAMEARLVANEHKSGWKNETGSWLLERAWEELGELTYSYLARVHESDEQALREGMRIIARTQTGYAALSPEQVHSVGREAADVGNLVMMVADVAGALEAAPTGLSCRVRDLLAQVAQMVHQGYHGDLPGTWQECPRDVCSSIRRELGR